MKNFWKVRTDNKIKICFRNIVKFLALKTVPMASIFAVIFFLLFEKDFAEYHAHTLQPRREKRRRERSRGARPAREGSHQPPEEEQTRPGAGQDTPSHLLSSARQASRKSYTTAVFEIRCILSSWLCIHYLFLRVGILAPSYLFTTH